VSENHCRCHDVEEKLHALEHAVESWAREESPQARSVDALTDAVVERIRFAAVAAAIPEEDQ
jgi:hypothetical protein